MGILNPGPRDMLPYSSAIPSMCAMTIVSCLLPPPPAILPTCATLLILFNIGFIHSWSIPFSENNTHSHHHLISHHHPLSSSLSLLYNIGRTGMGTGGLGDGNGGGSWQWERRNTCLWLWETLDRFGGRDLEGEAASIPFFSSPALLCLPCVCLVHLHLCGLPCPTPPQLHSCVSTQTFFVFILHCVVVWLVAFLLPFLCHALCVPCGILCLLFLSLLLCICLPSSFVCLSSPPLFSFLPRGHFEISGCVRTLVGRVCAVVVHLRTTRAAMVGPDSQTYILPPGWPCVLWPSKFILFCWRAHPPYHMLGDRMTTTQPRYNGLPSAICLYWTFNADFQHYRFHLWVLPCLPFFRALSHSARHSLHERTHLPPLLRTRRYVILAILLFCGSFSLRAWPFWRYVIQLRCSSSKRHFPQFLSLLRLNLLLYPYLICS